MRSYHARMGAGLDGLSLREHPEPRPGPRQVVVRIRAVSLNARELMIVFEGRYPLPVKPDVVPACDGAGEIVALGDGVSRARIGDRVMGAVFPRWQAGPFRMETAEQLGGSLDGMLTELAVLEEDALVPIPAHLSFEEAATLPCAAVTAWNALTGGRPLQAGETVLTQGSGGVSLFAIQLARAAGARVLATTSSPEKAARLRALGAHEVIDYRAMPEWWREVRRLTGGAGADHVVEGGGPATLEQSFQALATGGEVALVGALARGASAVDLVAFQRSVGSMRRIAVGSRAQFLALAQAFGAHALRLVIGEVFRFEETPAAFAHYAAGGAIGKTVITLG
jgi:NADPH:quinone reductase-like Zn-dependent oxidoreductase